MAKFKKGDRVRRVSGVIYGLDPTPIGGINYVDEDDSIVPYGTNENGDGGRSVIDEDNYELDEPMSLPDTVVINGVEYIRKPEPEPEHVWEWGQWARVKDTGDVVFVLDWEPLSNAVIIARKSDAKDVPVFQSGYNLTYIGTAQIPN